MTKYEYGDYAKLQEDWLAKRDWAQIAHDKWYIHMEGHIAELAAEVERLTAQRDALLRVCRAMTKALAGLPFTLAETMDMYAVIEEVEAAKDDGE